jgi:hypothetical protein
MIQEGLSRVRNRPANSAHEFEPLISTIRTASILGFGGSTPKRRGDSPSSTQRQEFPLSRNNQMLIEQIGMGGDLDPFVAAGDDRQDSASGRNDPHIVLQLRHVFFSRRDFRERPGQHELARRSLCPGHRRTEKGPRRWLP